MRRAFINSEVTVLKLVLPHVESAARMHGQMVSTADETTMGDARGWKPARRLPTSWLVQSRLAATRDVLGAAWWLAFVERFAQ